MIQNFQMEAGDLVPAITTEQMQKVDSLAIEKYGPNLYQMMENAGRNLALLTKQLLGQSWQKAHIIILAGTGGNGGGGICAGRHLANHGGKVQLAITKSERLGGVPADQRRIFRASAGSEQSLDSLDKADIIIDAVIGYSLAGAPGGAALQFIQWANAQKAPKLSLDAPSGLDTTTGAVRGEYIRAAATLTLALPKTGLVPEKTGELYLGDIGIPAAVYKEIGIHCESPFSDQYIISLKSVQ